MNARKHLPAIILIVILSGLAFCNLTLQYNSRINAIAYFETIQEDQIRRQTKAENKEDETETNSDNAIIPVSNIANNKKEISNEQTVESENIETPTYTYTELEHQLMYVVDTVNVRSLPSTDGNILTQIESGTKVTVMSQCNETGWYKVATTSGGDAFISNNYLSFTPPVIDVDPLLESKEIITTGWNDVLEYGEYVGRIIIPTIGIDVGLYQGNGTESQEIVDAEDSAAIFEFGVESLVADHFKENFAPLCYIETGAELYIINDTTAYKYVCTQTDTGENLSYDVVNSNEVSLKTINDGGLCLYTCTYEEGVVTLAFFQPTN